MATIEATNTVDRQRGSDAEDAVREPVQDGPSGVAAPVIPADLLTFDFIAEFLAAADLGNAVPAKPEIAAAPTAVEADAHPIPAPSEAGVAATIQADTHGHAVAPQVQASASAGSGFAFFHDWVQAAATESHPTHHHAASDELLMPWQQDEALLAGGFTWSQSAPDFSSPVADYALPMTRGGDIDMAATALPIETDTVSTIGDLFAAAFAAMKTGGLSMLDTPLTLAYLGATTGMSGAMTMANGDLMATMSGGRFVTIDATSKDGDGAALLHQLESIGLQSGSSFGGIASGFLAVDQIGALTGLSDLAFASESQIFSDAGVVTSQGDKAMLADTARTTYAVDGTGITVGVLSDSFNTSGNTDTMAKDIANGDLPASTTVLTDHASGTDEGRAMAQIVHDVAPGASILFETAYNGLASFANSIIDLAAHGAKVIVDDVTYFAETAYQDGPIAQAIDQVVAAGAVYFTSAANNGRNGYEAAFVNSGTTAFGEALAQLTTGAKNYQVSLTLSPRADVYLSLQWNQPAASVSPGHGSQSDLDLFVVNSSGTLITYSASNNIGGDPIELVHLTNSSTTSNLTYFVEVGYDAASLVGVPSDFKLVAMDNGSGAAFGASTLNTNDGTIFGHAAAAGAIAVGAAYYAQTPAYGVNPAVLESYSSNGPTTISYDTAGNPLATPIVRSGPAVVAPDGGNTSFFYPGDNPDGDAYPNFFGTSAAAPHAAAVAALMLQANSALNAGDIRNLMQDSALDMDDSSTAGFDKGFDNATGAGLLQANLAVGYASTLTITATAATTVLLGTHLNDTIVGGAGSHTFDGGAGLDKLSYAAAASAVTVNLATGTATNGFGGTDTFKNFESFVGGSGNDTFIGAAGSYAFDGGAGTDKLDYSAAPGAVTINLMTGTAINGFGGTDTFTNIETFVSGSSGDTFIGGSGSHSFDAGAGIDKLDYSGAGSAVTVNLATGTATNGFGGTDTFKNFESFVGGGSSDTFIGAAGSYAFDGGAGGTDKLDYSAAAGTVTINLAAGTATNGFGGTDTFTNIETFVSGTGTDTFIGGPGSHSFDGGAGTDKLDYSAAPGAVTINLTTGTATNGFGGADTFTNIETFVSGSSGDTFIGGPGSHSFDGGAGIDKLDYSGAGSAVTVNLATGTATNGFGGTDTFKNFESFVGGGSSDTFIGAAGSYAFDGGAGGTDKLDYSAATGAVTINLATGTAINGFGGTDTFTNIESFVSGNGTDTFIGGVGSYTFDGGAGIDKLDYSGAGSAVTINLATGTATNGFGGTDTFKNFETFIGGGSNDTFIGAAGSRTFDGGAGTDTLDYSAAPGAVTVNLATGTASNGFGGTDTFKNIEAFIGGAGNDVFNAAVGNYTLTGGAGNDTFNMGANLTAADQIDGGGDFDTVTLAGNYSAGVTFSATTVVNVELLTLAAGQSYALTLDDATNSTGLTVTGSALAAANFLHLDGSAETSAALTATGGAGADLLTGGAGNDILSGGGGNDILNGNGGDDILTAGTGVDVLSGGAGNDTFILDANLSALDQIDGGADRDTLSLSGNYIGGVVFTATTVVNVEEIDLADGNSYRFTLNDATNTSGLTIDGSLITTGRIIIDGSAETSAPLTVLGTLGNDTLTGGAGADNFVGGGGNDTMTGNGGNDTLTAGAGNDILNGNAGDDTLTAGGGTDTLAGGAGNDVLILGGNLDPTDKIDGGTDADTLKLDGDYSAGVVFGATTVINVETITLAAGNDYKLTLNNATNTTGLTVDGSALSPTDFLSLDGSAETSSALIATGGAGNDTLTGGAGNDRLDGGSGDDLITSGSGIDTLFGGSGNDVLILGASLSATDKIDGGADYDTVTLSGNYSAGLVFTATTLINVEEIDLAAGNSYKLTLNDANDTGGLKIDGSLLAAGQTLTISGVAETTSSLVLLGGSGNDTLIGGAGDDTLKGGDGNDTLTPGVGTDAVDGGAGNDTIVMAGNLIAADQIDGGSDFDTVTLAGNYSAGVTFTATTMVNVELMTLAAGQSYALTLDDATNSSGLTVTGSALGAANFMHLDGSLETSAALTATGGAGADILTGGAGNDVLSGGSGNDILNGNGGDDVLTAGIGVDVLNGGAGNDTFILDANLSAADKIDGGADHDVLSLSGNYIGGVVFTATTLVNVEEIDLADGNSYRFTLHDATNTSDLTIDGSLITTGRIIIDGSAETSAPLTVLGTLGNDTLTGGAGADHFVGGGGNDTLTGNGGNDFLFGGAGDDIMTGGAGRDTFYYNAASDAGTGKDQVNDFALGATGDVLDVHDLLGGFSGYNGSNAFSGGYLNFQNTGGNTVVQIDADGGGNNYTTLVTLQHVTLTAANTDNYVV